MINILSGLDSTSAALSAERTRMDIVAQNLANANVTQGPDGKPYQRQQVVFESVLNQAQGAGFPGGASQLVRVARVEGDPRGPRMVYNPGHPGADANGMLAVPNVNVHEEMVDMMAASRTFEANLAVLKTARSMAMQTLSIGKR